MSRQISVTEAARHFAEYVNRAAYRGENFILMRGKKPLAELRPVPTGTRLAELPALLASLPRLSEAEAAEFAHDLEEARSAIAPMEDRDPWEP